MLPELTLAPELVTGGLVMWTIILLALVCYGLLFEAVYYRYQKINAQWIASWLTPLQVLISSLPLLGLLGTIIGLLDTFSALGHNADVSISDGIGKAMLTTQAGLLMSIPAMVILWKLQEASPLTLEPALEHSLSHDEPQQSPNGAQRRQASEGEHKTRSKNAA
jgi:biopolymer transport protein ExbB